MNPDKHRFWLLAVLPALLTQSVACVPQNPTRADPAPTPSTVCLDGERSGGPVTDQTYPELQKTGSSIATIMPFGFIETEAFIMTNRAGEICFSQRPFNWPNTMEHLEDITA